MHPISELQGPEFFHYIFTDPNGVIIKMNFFPSELLEWIEQQ
jgi:hypothetical protein